MNKKLLPNGKARVVVRVGRDGKNERERATEEANKTLRALKHPERPKTRADCKDFERNGHRPCPWVGCKHHLVMEVRESTGAIVGLQPNFITIDENGVPVVDWDRVEHSCTLDIAEKYPEGMTHEKIGAVIGLTRARVDQHEKQGLAKLYAFIRRNKEAELLLPRHLVRVLSDTFVKKTPAPVQVETDTCLGCGAPSPPNQTPRKNPLDVGYCRKCRTQRARERYAGRVREARRTLREL